MIIDKSLAKALKVPSFEYCLILASYNTDWDIIFFVMGSIGLTWKFESSGFRASSIPDWQDKIKRIKKSTKFSKYEEGCLSIPNLFAEVQRPTECEVEYLDYNGKSKILKADGLLATCIQHEIDHLKGILFIDYLSKLKRDIILKKLSKQKLEQKRLVI